MNKVVVVSASWCGSCQSLKFQLDKANVDYSVVDAVTDEGMAFCQENGVRGLPTTFVYDGGGELLSKVVGNNSQEVLKWV